MSGHVPECPCHVFLPAMYGPYSPRVGDCVGTREVRVLPLYIRVPWFCYQIPQIEGAAISGHYLAPGKNTASPADLGSRRMLGNASV